MAVDQDYDVVIVGAGVLGASLAYFLSLGYNGKVAILDREKTAGEHTSSRNTGVIHRPFYLNPEKKRIFAKSSQDSYALWKELAGKYNLPWKDVGTLEVAVRDADTRTIDEYRKWGPENGMEESELQVLDESELKQYEPDVKGHGAILSRTDASVDFGVFTRKLIELAQAEGVKYLGNFKVSRMEENGVASVKYTYNGTPGTIRANFMINAAGGDALKLAHKLGLARRYATLHFRGDYWTVSNHFANGIRNNIYTVPRHMKFPFLDPHFILRQDGRREVGPTAALVASPYDYTDSPDSHSLLLKLLEKPAIPKLKLVTNPEFINLVRTEWKSSRSKAAMAERVREFIPTLKTDLLESHGLSGIRNSLIDSNGFVPEAVIEKGQDSYHVLNYNSPGATGAPAYAMYILKMAENEGFLKLNGAEKTNAAWHGYHQNSG